MNALIKNSARLLSANVIAQAIGLVVYPILTRLYTPEDFGLLHLFLSIGGILVILANAEYHYAIVRVKEEREAHLLLVLELLLICFISGLTLISTCFSPWIARWFKAPNLANWFWLMPLFVFTAASWNVLNYWYIRTNSFHRLSGYQYSLTCSTTLSKLGFGYGRLLQGGLIVSTVIGQTFSVILSIVLSWKKSIRDLIHIRTNDIEIKHISQQYKTFPCYNLPRTFLNYIIGQLPVLLLTPLFGQANVGHWGMAILLGFSPIAMINKSINQVLYSHITKLVHQNEHIAPLFKRFTIYAFICIILGGALLYWLMPSIVGLLLGKQWLQTANILRWMLPWISVTVLAGSTAFVFDLFLCQKQGLFAEILLAIGRCTGLTLGIVKQSFMGAVIGYCVGSCIAVIIQYLWIIYIVQRYEHTLANQTLK